MKVAAPQKWSVVISSQYVRKETSMHGHSMCPITSGNCPISTRRKATNILNSYGFWENWEANRARSLWWCPAKGRTNKLRFPLTQKNTQKDVLESRFDSWCCLWHWWLLLPQHCDAPWCSSSSWDPVSQDTSCSWPLVPALLGLAFKGFLYSEPGGSSESIVQSLWFSSQKKQQFLKTSTGFQRGLFSSLFAVPETLSSQFVPLNVWGLLQLPRVLWALMCSIPLEQVWGYPANQPLPSHTGGFDSKPDWAESRVLISAGLQNYSPLHYVWEKFLNLFSQWVAADSPHITKKKGGDGKMSASQLLLRL